MYRFHLSYLVWVAVILFGASASLEAQQRPNIVLAMADDQGWGDMAYNGHPVLKTPHFDELASSGLRFDRFYAAAPVCSPTRGSVLTGRHPNRFGCFLWGHSLRPEEITVAEVLQRNGYRTGHFGKWHLGPVRADSPVSPGMSGFQEWLSAPNFFEIDPWMSRNGEAVQTKGEGSMVTVEAALEFIEESMTEEQPFLAVVWFGSPHSPHEALERDRALYQDQPEEMKNFLSEITAMDRAMGHLRTRLRELGIADNTVLWYTSDNGAIPEGSTGGLSGRKGELWEGGIRVPAIVEWPSTLKEPRITDFPASTVDIFPTVLEMAGISTQEAIHPLDGISLLDMIQGKLQSREKPLGFWAYPGEGQPVRSDELVQQMAEEQKAGREVPAEESPPFRTGLLDKSYSQEDRPGHAAWIDGVYKLHRIPDDSGNFRYALFDLSRDPAEENDLISQFPDRARAMQEELEEWQRSVIDSLNGVDYRER